MKKVYEVFIISTTCFDFMKFDSMFLRKVSVFEIQLIYLFLIINNIYKRLRWNLLLLLNNNIWEKRREKATLLHRMHSDGKLTDCVIKYRANLTVLFNNYFSRHCSIGKLANSRTRYCNLTHLENLKYYRKHILNKRSK